ncbi:hypothetical protein C8A00DRAFT_13503 [Chaetomidium leptoderma]|uniref:Uncharacterized protein n=1 Tax=Chaetomidium leptoderma TaxID=669021 RepID=A0AAN6VPK4_9PEZI|nr:hypothetical protein C8A00DRAFT_13503 [Chaetomidium leptoderma]
MVERDHIESLLETGSWRTLRSKSPNPYDSHRRTYEPRRSNIGVPRFAQPASHSKRPPPPCVEDEKESLAKEHAGSVVSDTSDEEAQHRGDIDQQPILLPVHEHNPERRFVLVPGAAEDDAPKTDQARYDANTCRKYVLVDSENGTDSGEGGKDKQKQGPPKDKPARPDGAKERPDIPKRKSHQDLPRLTTDLEEDDDEISIRPIRRSGSRRDRERPVVHQEAQDYPPSSRDRSSARPPDSAFLLPAAVKYAAGRRDRAYSDARSDTGKRPSRSPSTRRDADVEVSGRRRPHHSSRYPAASPGLHRRASSTTSVPVRDGSPAERPISFMQPYGHGDPDEIFAFMAPGDDFMTGKPGRDVSPQRRARNSNSPPHPRGAREMPGPSPNRRRPPRPTTRDRDGYSSDDSYKERRPNRTERPHPTRSALDPDYPLMPPPDQSRRPGSRPTVPSSLVAHAAQFPDDPPQPSPRSATFPADKSRRVGERSISPSPAASTSPSRRPARGSKVAQPGLHSRDASIGSASNGSASLPSSVPTALARASTLDRPLPGPVATLARQESSDPQSPTLYWQPHRDEEGNVCEDEISHGLVSLPDCRWKNPTLARNRAGSEQFLTLKRAENFTICPACYGALFANTQFQHLFVSAPTRSGDQVISCDFGSSPWYRIAYLMTMQHEYPDLRLLQGIASVAARSQVCTGTQPASRIWYSMMAPHSRRPVQTFNACHGCAKMVEVLLPNLAGVFVPLDSHEATRGICELHFAPDRKRFFDYFDEMKTTSAKSLSRRTAPNLTELVDRIREISLHEECLRNTPIPNRRWHVMQRVPEFTVCEECFNIVVWPKIESEDDSEVPTNFYKSKQLMPLAACQLYSARMRRVFREACKYDDFEFLASCVLHRLQVLAEVKERYKELQREDPGDPDVQDVLADLAKQFRDVE